MTRAAALGMIESEVSVLIRRVRRVIGERARAVHEGLQPAAYLLLAHLADSGPCRSSVIVEAFGIDKGVQFATLQLLAGVVTHCVVLTAPFSAAFSVWLSNTAAVGLASRPSRSRKAA